MPEQSRDRKLEFLFLAACRIACFVLHLALWLLGRGESHCRSGVTQGSQLVPGWPSTDPNVGITSQALGISWPGIGCTASRPGGIPIPASGAWPANWRRFSCHSISSCASTIWQREEVYADHRRACHLYPGAGAGLKPARCSHGGCSVCARRRIASDPDLPRSIAPCPISAAAVGIERQKTASRRVSILAIGVAIAVFGRCLAGFPEPTFISGLLALAFYRLISQPNRWNWPAGRYPSFCARPPGRPRRSSPLNYLRQSNSFAMHTGRGAVSFPWAAFSTTVMPYVYGPLQVSFNSARLLSNLAGSWRLCQHPRHFAGGGWPGPELPASRLEAASAGLDRVGLGKDLWCAACNGDQ